MNDSDSKTKKRFPAKGIRATLHPYLDEKGGFFVRLYDDNHSFKDYDLTHYDLEIIITDDSAEFIETDQGNILDYSEEALGVSNEQD